MYKEDELWVWLDARVSFSHDFQEQKGILHVKVSMTYIMCLKTSQRRVTLD